MFSPKKKKKNVPVGEKPSSPKKSGEMALAERPLTIGCCQPPVAATPHSEKMRSQTGDPSRHSPASPSFAETNYEGQGISAMQRFPLRRHNVGWWGSPLLPSPSHLAASRLEQGQRRKSSQSSVLGDMEDMGVSVIDKEDLLDTIFISCDTEGKGRVAVSRVIQHIQMIVDSSESTDIDELALQLDPTGLDLEIDLQTYQNGIAQWIKNVQSKRRLETSGAMEDRPNPSMTAAAIGSNDSAPHWKSKSLDIGSVHPRSVSTPLSDIKPQWRTRHSEPSHLFSGLLDSSLDLSTCSYGSLEAQGGESTQDMADLQNRIEDLQFQIRKLSEHNMKLQVQIETTDDTNEQLLSQIDTLKGELKNLQQAWHRSQSIRDENEELKAANKEWHKKHAQLEKDKRSLDDRLGSLQAEADKKQSFDTKLQAAQEKLSISLAEAESMQEELRKMQTLLQEHKHQNEATEAHLEVKNTELAEKVKRCEEMQTNLEELYNLNRVLKSEKTQLEVRLSEVRQELDSYQTQQLITTHEVQNMSPASSRTESGLGRSLHSELKSIVSADGNLPSPICGNEDFDFENHMDDDSAHAPSNTLSRQSSLSSNASSSSLTADQLLAHFRQQKDDIMEQLQQFLEEEVQEKAETEDTEESRKVAFTQLLDQELNVMVEKLTSLAKTKKQLEHRANKFSFMLQSLQDDYVRISKKYEEAIKHCKELTATKSEVERLRADNQMLEFDVKRGKQKTEELEKNLSLCQQDLETAHTAQQKYRQLAETQLGELRRLFKEMEKKYKISQDNAKKQEATYKARITQQSTTHQAQLKTFLDLVTADCHRVGQTLIPQVVTATQDTVGSNGPLDGSQVIDSVSSYLTGLKTQLAKTRSQVFSLKREKFCLEHGTLRVKRTEDQNTQSQSSLNCIARTGRASRNCSVLIDALSLEIGQEDSKYSSHFLQHYPSDKLPWRQSQDDSVLHILMKIFPSTAFIDKLHYRLFQESVAKRSQRKSHTVSTQTEILRTPDRETRPYSRSSSAQTSINIDLQEGRDSGTQTDSDSVDEFKSSSYRISNGANIKQAYLVNKPPTLNSAVLLPLEEASLSPADSGSDLNDSFVTAYSSPVSSSPLKSSLRGSLEQEDFADFLGSPIITRNSSLESPCPSSVDQELRDCRESRSRSLVLTPDIKLASLHRKSAQDRQEAAQKMADLLATSYARPNIIVEGCQADSEDNDVNANYDRSGKYGPATPRKHSPARLKRRSHSDKEKDKRTTSSGSECKSLDQLLTSKLPEVDMTQEQREFNQRLLEASKKASERHKNRRGRKWSPSTSPDQRSLSPITIDRSRSPSPCQTPPTADQPCSSAASTPEKLAETSQGVTVPTADGVTEGTADTSGELQEERTGAEGESDKEDNKLTTKSERKDSEVEVFDIKADILKATGSLQAEMPQIKPLAKLREEHKLQRKTNIHFTMPELTEATESDPASRVDNSNGTIAPTTTATTLASPHSTPVPGSPGPDVLHNSREDSSTKGHREGSRDQEEQSSCEEKSSLIPDSVLLKLGLKGGQGKDTSAMTETEIEETFNSLQLAFKANQYTLQNRLTLQHRQRDLAEKNIDREIEGLILTLQMLEPLASIDTVSRDYLNRIRQHVEVLQSSSLRLSSKAESFGAVQQEGRLSKATDVMISHVENLKRLFEREHAELEDTRKLLQENRKLFRGNSITNNLSIDGDADSKLFSRRALSVSGGNSKKPTSLFQLAKMLTNPGKNASSRPTVKGKPVVTTQIRHQSYRPQTCSLFNENRKRATSCAVSPRFVLANEPIPEINESNQAGRRRASVATVAGSGLLSSSFGPQSRIAGAVRRTSVQLSSSLNAEDFKDAKARLTGSLSTGTINRHSLLSRTDSSIVVRRRSSDSSPTEFNGLDASTSATPSPSSPLPSPGGRDAVSLPATSMVQVIDPEGIKRGLAKVEAGEAKGSKNGDEAFRQGYEQGIRTQVTHELADLREQQKAFCDNLEELIDQAEEEQEENEQEAERNKSSRGGIISRLHQLGRRWPRATRIARLALTAFIFLFALVYVFLTVVPLEACLGSSPVTYSPWRTLKEVLWPYTELRHHNPPPR